MSNYSVIHSPIYKREWFSKLKLRETLRGFSPDEALRDVVGRYDIELDPQVAYIVITGFIKDYCTTSGSGIEQMEAYSFFYKGTGIHYPSGVEYSLEECLDALGWNVSVSFIKERIEVFRTTEYDDDLRTIQGVLYDKDTVGYGSVNTNRSTEGVFCHIKNLVEMYQEQMPLV